MAKPPGGKPPGPPSRNGPPRPGRGRPPGKGHPGGGRPPGRNRPPAVMVRGATAPAQAGELWLYGRHAVAAALANPRRTCHRLLATEEALTELGAAAHRPGLDTEKVAREAIDRQLGPDVAHQGLALRVAPLPTASIERACQPAEIGRPVLVLDGVTDPHNLGAILRSAAAFGARAVILPHRQSALANGAAAKAASGALEIVPLVEVPNLARALVLLKSMGYWVVGLDGHAPEPIGTLASDAPLVLVLGAEGTGLRRLVAESCDKRVRLPIGAAVESLNVSVAAGIALYALAAARPGS